MIIPTILCGGVGSRLWPVSRELHPKPFIRLADGQTLLQKAFLRSACLPQVQEILTVTNRELFFKTEDEFRAVNQAQLATSYILEPVARDTAAAIAMATLYVADKHGEDAILLVLPADHLINDQHAFKTVVAEAERLAQQGMLVTFGIQPDRPETGYGYIEADGERVLRFVEKPSLDRAISYLQSGRYLWNSGMFCFSAKTMLRQMAQHCPEILSATKRCFDQARRSEGMGFSQLRLDAEHFAAVPKKSIDYAVMEPASLHSDARPNIAVVPCDIGWSDIGSWDAVGDLTAADSQNNRVEGNALLEDTRDCYIRSSDRLVGTIGVDNLIVIDTPDALLIADRARAQDVRRLYARLQADGNELHKLHRVVHRPWGTYTVLQQGPGFKIKLIVVKPGASLSLQLHHHRSEHWVVVSGVAKVIGCGGDKDIQANGSTYIPVGQKHRLKNPGDIEAVIVEVQTGDYLGEDDIVRFEDDFDRVSP